MKNTGTSSPATLLDGLIAGAVATWLMGRVTSALYERESKPAREKEDAARGGRTAYEVAAEQGARALDTSLSDEERSRYGARIHWALGIGAGVVYALLRRRMELETPLAGLAFGAAFWLAMDEGAVYALGLTPGPTAFPWQTHARGLAGHLAFGATADTALRVLERR